MQRSVFCKVFEKTYNSIDNHKVESSNNPKEWEYRTKWMWLIKFKEMEKRRKSRDEGMNKKKIFAFYNIKLDTRIEQSAHTTGKQERQGRPIDNQNKQIGKRS